MPQSSKVDSVLPRLQANINCTQSQGCVQERDRNGGMCSDRSCSKSLVCGYVEMFGDRSLCITTIEKLVSCGVIAVYS